MCTKHLNMLKKDVELCFDMEFQLIIRAPNQNIKDQLIKCEIEWTVLRLKAHLSKVYPSKPAISKQKLIYSGHLLLDHLQLRDYIRSEDTQSNVHILHLVYNGYYNPPKQNENSISIQNSSNQPSYPESSGLPDISSTSENVLRHRSQVEPQINNYQMPIGAFPILYSDPQALAQITTMYQMYAQYMAQYYQNVNIAALAGNPPILPFLPNFQIPQNNPNNTGSEAAVHQQGNQRVNVVEVMQDNEVARDWLDNIFQYCRFLILLSIVYFYSTPERFMLVILCAVIALLYREGWFMRQTLEEAVLRRRNTVQAEIYANNENEQAPPNQEDVNDGQELEAAMDGENPPHAQNPDIVNNNQGFSALSILAAFFFSLVPEPPPPVNIN